MPSLITKQQWIDWINEQEQSDLSIAAFCRQKEIKADNFYYHRKQERKTNLADSSPFVRATASAKPVAVIGSEPITLICGRNCLKLPRDVSPKWLAALMAALA